jgi:hypothetical protein
MPMMAQLTITIAIQYTKGTALTRLKFPPAIPNDTVSVEDLEDTDNAFAASLVMNTLVYRLRHGLLDILQGKCYAVDVSVTAHYYHCKLHARVLQIQCNSTKQVKLIAFDIATPIEPNPTDEHIWGEFDGMRVMRTLLPKQATVYYLHLNHFFTFRPDPSILLPPAT